MLTSGELMEEAAAQTGLTDFGDDSFTEGLNVLLSALRDEAHLNERGEAFLRQRIAGYLSQRLQVEDWFRRHPEIGDVPIREPLVGLGLPRTGSTALSMLLAQDPEVRYLRRWESTQPCPRPRRCTASIPASRPTGARWSAPAATFPATPMGPWSATS